MRREPSRVPSFSLFVGFDPSREPRLRRPASPPVGPAALFLPPSPSVSTRVLFIPLHPCLRLYATSPRASFPVCFSPSSPCAARSRSVSPRPYAYYHCSGRKEGRGVREPAENKFATSRPRTCAGQQREIDARDTEPTPLRNFRAYFPATAELLYALPARHPVGCPSLCDPSRRVATPRNGLRKFSVHPIDCGFSMQAIRGVVLMGLHNTGCIRGCRLFFRNMEGSELFSRCDHRERYFCTGLGWFSWD